MFYLGLDLAKLTFEACLLNPDKSIRGQKSFKRTSDGLERLVRWVRDMIGSSQVWAIMEATGDLWFLPAELLDDAGFLVSIVKKNLAKVQKLSLDCHGACS